MRANNNLIFVIFLWQYNFFYNVLDLCIYIRTCCFFTYTALQYFTI